VPEAGRTIGEAIIALGDFSSARAPMNANDLQLRLVGLLAKKTLRTRMLGSAAISLA
jgi:hypothetical protein